MKLEHRGTLLCMIFWVQCVWAQPTVVSADTRLVTFEFDPDKSYLVLTRPKSVTHIQLAPNEMINTAVAGDTSNFSVVVSANRTSVLVRPKYEGLTTSLTLITNARSYPMVLRSTPEATGKWYQRVNWHFEEMELNALSPIGNPHDLSASLQTSSLSAEGILRARPLGPEEMQGEVHSNDVLASLHPNSTAEAQTSLSLDLDRLTQLRSQYSVEGSADFKPLQVFDDGQRMYLHMPDEMQNFPAIFALEEDHAQLINFSLAKRFVVIQGLHSELLLKNGSLEVKVKRTPSSNGFWGGLLHGNR